MMAASRPDRELPPRDREILAEVVRAFISSGSPVSSRAVAKHSASGLSAASIRNTMADLEEAGLLSQPHASAGRVPTEAGYHLYIESLMTPDEVSTAVREYIDASFTPDLGEELAPRASRLLSELSSQIGFVVTPGVGDTRLKSIEFVGLSGTRVLCVVVSADGFMESKVIDAGDALPREELVRISNYLTESFGGATLREARDRLVQLLSEERARVDRLLAHSISLAQEALGGGEPNLLVEGTNSLLGRPELSSLERVRRLVETFDNRARVVRMLSQLIQGRGVRVVIGEESDLTSDLDFSLVATTYGAGEEVAGTLGIFGPSRMPYERVVPLVSFLGDRLSRALEATLE